MAAENLQHDRNDQNADEYRQQQLQQSVVAVKKGAQGSAP
jgi:hypothetical protein